MTQLTEREKNRRSFMKYLAASPVLGLSAKSAMAGTAAQMNTRPADPYMWWPRDPTYLIERPEDALDVFEFEPVAHKNTPPAHFGFVTAGADDEGEGRHNRDDLGKFALRSRRLRDVSQADTTRQIFGMKFASPFFLCPVGFERAMHVDGVMGAARAAGRQNIAQFLSTFAGASIGQAAEARKDGIAPWFQLYNMSSWDIVKSLVQRAEREGSKVLAVTVDTTSTRVNTQAERAKREDKRFCATCHIVRDPRRPKNANSDTRAAPMMSEVTPAMWEQNSKTRPEPLTWEFIKRLRDVTKMEIFIKGIMNPEDAAMCAKYGYGVYVSNHGGRQSDTGASSISVLEDVVSVVKKKVPVFIDSGFRRGMDIVKAMTLGADMVGVGRPWLWGLGAFGEAGVEKVLQILEAEFKAAMQQVGAKNLEELTPALVTKAL